MTQEVIVAANRHGLSEPIEKGNYIERLLHVTVGMGAYRPSMMVDHRQSSPLELAASYGIPLQRAANTTTPMPRVAMLHALLEATEQKERQESQP